MHVWICMFICVFTFLFSILVYFLYTCVYTNKYVYKYVYLFISVYEYDSLYIYVCEFMASVGSACVFARLGICKANEEMSKMKSHSMNDRLQVHS